MVICFLLQRNGNPRDWTFHCWFECAFSVPLEFLSNYFAHDQKPTCTQFIIHWSSFSSDLLRLLFNVISRISIASECTLGLLNGRKSCTQTWYYSETSFRESPRSEISSSPFRWMDGWILLFPFSLLISSKQRRLPRPLSLHTSTYHTCHEYSRVGHPGRYYILIALLEHSHYLAWPWIEIDNWVVGVPTG